jgi:protein involved in polysaccharide export with SLBB domain
LRLGGSRLLDQLLSSPKGSRTFREPCCLVLVRFKKVSLLGHLQEAMIRILRVLMGSLAVVLAAACSSSPPPQATAPGKQASPELLPGDAVRVQVWRESDISGVFTVDDRGIVTLPLLGERQVSGLEPTELRDSLLTDYKEYLQNPSIEVTILRRINILGEVRSPGLYPVDATISLADALALAGGVTPTADPDKIQLVRDNSVIAEGVDQAAVIGASDIMSGDQIVVGQKSWLARNSGVLVGSLIAATALIAATLINN